jgi:hypothetical protein
MWDRIDTLLERAPHSEALRMHRVELLEARRRHAAGLDASEFAQDETTALACDLAAAPLLARVRDSYDGPLVLVKGPEVALDYPAPRTRRFSDLDLLTDDAERAQAALLAAGFQEVADPDLYVDIHHLRPLWWPGLPLVVELHKRPKWVDGLHAPSSDELLADAVAGRLGVDGVAALPAAQHTLLLAAHAWAHDPLGRLGDLIDVAVTLRRCDPAEVDALARRWDCSRMWRATHAAVRAVLDGEGRSAGAAVWARHLPAVRERTVFEWHVKDVLAPVWGLPPHRAAGRAPARLLAAAGPVGAETWRTKLRRARAAVGNAGLARSEHDLALDARGIGSTGTEEAG